VLDFSRLYLLPVLLHPLPAADVFRAVIVQVVDGERSIIETVEEACLDEHGHEFTRFAVPSGVVLDII